MGPPRGFWGKISAKRPKKRNLGGPYWVAGPVAPEPSRLRVGGPIVFFGVGAAFLLRVFSRLRPDPHVKKIGFKCPEILLVRPPRPQVQ